MLERYKDYHKVAKHHRKLFSEVQKRIIACRQKYKCPGNFCKSEALLPETWDLDHVIPLFLGGSNDYNFDYPSPDDKNNLQILCSRCHAFKSQQERLVFHEQERKNKFGTLTFVMAEEFYNGVKSEFHVDPNVELHSDAQLDPKVENGESSEFNTVPKVEPGVNFRNYPTSRKAFCFDDYKYRKRE